MFEYKTDLIISSVIFSSLFSCMGLVIQGKFKSYLYSQALDLDMLFSAFHLLKISSMRCTEVYKSVFSFCFLAMVGQALWVQSDHPT
jgi:hypothetical protein